MSHRTSPWLSAVAAVLATSSLGFGQDPIPVGYSSYQPHPAYWQQPYYGGMAYGYPPPYAMPQYPMPQYPPQYAVPQYAVPQAPQEIQPAALRHNQHLHRAPAAPVAVAAEPDCGDATPVVACKKKRCCGGLLCKFNHGPIVPLFDGKCLHGFFTFTGSSHDHRGVGDCGPGGCRHDHGHNPLIARRPGPTAIDSLAVHPFARGPRDYFMFYENLEAERSRDLRPALIP